MAESNVVVLDAAEAKEVALLLKPLLKFGIKTSEKFVKKICLEEGLL
jgi:hypothetical protein